MDTRVQQKVKKPFKGTFNWNGEIHTMYTSSYTKQAAISIFHSKLSKLVGRSPGCIKQYYNQKPTAYDVVEA